MSSKRKQQKRVQDNVLENKEGLSFDYKHGLCTQKEARGVLQTSRGIPVPGDLDLLTLSAKPSFMRKWIGQQPMKWNMKGDFPEVSLYAMFIYQKALQMGVAV